MGEPYSRPKITKSRHGCGECKRKRMRCDESRPTCKNCSHRNVQCPGYTKELKWSTKYEKFQEPKKAEPSRRPSSPLGQQIQEVIQSLGNEPRRRASHAETHVGDIHEASETTPRERISHSNSGSIDAAASGYAQALPETGYPTTSTDTFGPDNDLVDECIDTAQAIQNPTPQTDPIHPPPYWTSGTDDPTQLDLVLQQCLRDEQAILDEADVEEVVRSGEATNPLARKPEWHEYMSLWSDFSLTSNDIAVEKLMLHYFENICRVMSCFDSQTNPYRTHVPASLHQSPHIFQCMLGMSAAHLANYEKEMAVTAISYQTEAMNSLQQEMQLVLPLRPNDGSAAKASLHEILLGTIILGMTSAWHDATANGMSHLRGARLLFRAWSSEQQIIDPNGHPTILNREQSFIVGSMAYWECLASFIADQALDAIDYLIPFCKIAEGQTIYPNSWTGVGTPIFIHTAQVGILLRQKRVLAKLALIRRGTAAHDVFGHELVRDAQEIHERVMSYELPPMHMMEETGDPNTPVRDLCEVAKVYRFTALLELYRAFPSLVNPVDIPGPAGSAPRKDTSSVDDLTFDLATSIITVISDLPRNSGNFTVLPIPLISAGAALLICASDFPSSSKSSLDHELTRVRRSKSAVQWWREVIRQQILHTFRQIGLAAFQRVVKLVQEVWTRADVHVDMVADPGTTIHWVDVMTEQRLETLFG